MNDVDLQHFRDLLKARQQSLLDLDTVGKEAMATVELDQSRVGRVSRMDAMQGQAMARASQRRREDELKRVALALKRMETGDYGFCLDCDEPIARGRMESDPAAALCIECAGKRESG